MQGLISVAVLMLSSPVWASDIINVGPIVDTDTCYNALNESDTDGNGKINREEYVTVNQLLGPPDFLSDVTSFEDLPLILKATFNTLACACGQVPDAPSNCCVGDNAHLPINGTATGDMPTSEQSIFLFTVCLTTQSAIESTMDTSPPTFTPTTSPSATMTPTMVPSAVQSAAPSNVASLVPTTAGSDVPSVAPTTGAPIAVTAVPSAVTVAPTTTAPIVVTAVPSAMTVAPITTAPVAAPIVVTAVPSAMTVAPATAAPVGVPSAAPVSVAPVGFPTLTPTAMPSSKGDLPVQVVYLVAVTDGRTLNPSGYVEDLILAMNILAPQVMDEAFANTANGTRNLRRKLTVDFSFPTLVVGRLNQTCPVGSGTTSSDNCQDIIHSITLIVSDDENAAAVREIYISNLEAAVEAGRLQLALDQVNSESAVRILTGAAPVTDAPASSPIIGDGGLGGRAIVGIVVGAIFVVVLGGFAYARGRGDDKTEGAYFPGTSQQQLSEDRTVPAGGETLGATTPDYGKKGTKASKAGSDFEGGKDDAPEPLLLNESHDSSSNAGDSGWSSSAGVSSLRSGSFESLDGGGDSVPLGSTLAAIGVASAMAGVAASRERDDGAPELPQVTRDDLDVAIEAGDWAAVGATAALLAAASDSQSFSSRSRRSGTSASRGGSSMSSMDAARAAELDHLVDAGDWEGVVLAAAKFEATEDSSSKGSQIGGSGTGSSQYSGTGSHGYSPSTSVSESPSKIKKRDEIREEVEALVRRVVPEEIGNVDEMMMQFKGREEELVETLRTMQERQVAQKARVQGQKQAKRDAKMTVAAGGAGLPDPSTSTGGSGVNAAAGIAIGTAAAAGVAAGLAAVVASDEEESEVSSYSGAPAGFAAGGAALGFESGTDSDHDSNRRKRTALELAIEAGDWEAVGEAAAMMSDTSVTSGGSSVDIDNLALGASLSGASSRTDHSDESVERRRQLRSGVNAEHAAELDQMIDSGDWTGVVAAATRFSSSEGTPSDRSGSAYTSAVGASTVGSGTSGSADQQRQLKEEEDALAQAEIWMAIAEQSKQEGQTDLGASDAADWAIARSLSALKVAERTGELQRKKTPSDKDEAASVASSQDRSV